MTTVMVRPEKINQVNELKEKIQGASLVIFTDCCGLTVGKITELRSQLRKGSTEFKVYKNTFARRALKDLNIDFPDEILSGPTSIVSTSDDPARAAKILKTFAKDNEEKVSIKGGIFQNTTISESVVQQLASLPSRNELLAKVVGAVQGPISGLVQGLSSPLRGLVNVLKAIQDKK